MDRAIDYSLTGEAKRYVEERDWSDGEKGYDLVRDLLAEVERLRAENVRWFAAAGDPTVERLEAEVVRLREALAAAEGERDRALFLMECADTPLMRDVMAERDAAREALAAAEAEATESTNAWSLKLHEAYRQREMMRQQLSAVAKREAAAREALTALTALVRDAELDCLNRGRMAASAMVWASDVAAAVAAASDGQAQS